MNRNAAYKISGLKLTNTTKARAQRLDEQNKNRQIARQAKNDAKRGLVELDQNVLNLNGHSQVKPPTEEMTHEQKLKERLARLKVWREEKIQAEQKAKAKKKVPFVVPGVARGNKVAAVEPKPCPTKQPAGRVTRSQAKRTAETENQWTVTSNPKTQLAGKKTVKVSKPTIHSFAPKGFVFTAPKEIVVKALEYQESAKLPSAQPTSETPQKLKSSDTETDDDIKISPLVINHPWISTTRGSSSKKKRMSLEAMNSDNQEPQSSPFLKRRSEIKRNSVAVPPNEDALHFRALMAREGSRLTDLCVSWDELLANNEVPEEETGSVRTVIGQAQLLQRERFNQFAELVNQFENKTGEKEITPTDLEGFWEMIYLQVSDVDKKFEDLDKLKANGWVHLAEEPVKKTRAVKKKAPAAVQARAATSNIRAMIAAARKKQLAEKSCGSPLINKRRSSFLMSPIRTPGKRQSLRRSVLINSAKKPVFIVTELVPKESEDMDSMDGDSELVVSSPQRRSKGLVLDSDTNSSASEVEIHPAITPGSTKTYGRTGGYVTESTSPEQRLSAAFNALKTGTSNESSDRMTPLKVFRSPYKTRRSNVQPKILNTDLDSDVMDGEAPVALSPRRSTRNRGANNTTAPKERLSLLPTVSISPVVPSENLMSFD